MRDAWDGPVLRYFYITMLLLPLVALTLVAFTIKEVLGDLATMAVVIGATYLPIFFVMFLARHRFMEEWNSNRRFVAVDFQEARPRLEAAFASAGLAHREVATDDPKRGVRYELGRGLGAELLMGERNGKCVVYVWPVNDRTRRDVDGLKRRIDAAFPPAR